MSENLSQIKNDASAQGTDSPATGYRQRLENCLIEDFGAVGQTLNPLTESIAGQLPEDVVAQLRGLASTAAHVESSTSDMELLNFAFDCGRMLERLTQLRRDQADTLLAFATNGASTPADVEIADLEGIARILALRDRILRKVADFSLKLLLMTAALTLLGLLLGVI